MKRMITALAGLACSCGVSASIETHAGAFGPLGTNWTHAFGVQQFDGMGGTRVLDSVNIALIGSITGESQGENMDAAPATVMLDLQANISLSLGLTQLAVVAPTVKSMFDAAAFDGTVDYMGPSGETFLGLNHSDNTSTLLTSAAELAAWLGAGTVTLDGAAEGSSSGSGAGNLMTVFGVDGALDFEVTYTFHEVPAPGALAVAGIAGVVGIRRRR